MTGIIGAMQVEVETLQKEIQNPKTERISGIDFVSGKLCGKDVVVAMCGIGKVFAAICAQTMILKYGVDKVINTGAAGTLTDKLGITDIAVSTSCVQHDMDTSPLGDPKGFLSGINIVNIPVSPKLSDLVVECAKEVGLNVASGVIASGDQFVHSKERKDFIVSNFDGIACEMEGAAIAHVCYVNGVDCVIIRSISDTADGSAFLEYSEFCKKAAHNSAMILSKLLNKIDF